MCKPADTPHGFALNSGPAACVSNVPKLTGNHRNHTERCCFCLVTESIPRNGARHGETRRDQVSEFTLRLCRTVGRNPMQPAASSRRSLGCRKQMIFCFDELYCWSQPNSLPRFSGCRLAAATRSRTCFASSWMRLWRVSLR